MGRRSGAWVVALAAAGLLAACDSSERTGVQVADAAAREDAAPVNPASIEALTLLFQVSGALVELGARHGAHRRLRLVHALTAIGAVPSADGPS